jgi:uncharacterized membrane protein
MIFTNEVLIHIAVVVLGLSGLMVAKHVYHHKKTGQLLVCPIRFDCNSVVNSDYSKFFGIPVEFMGMFYYGLTAVVHALFFILPSLSHTLLSTFSLIMATSAFIFSLYLIGVQIFALKKGCSWCFVSAGISTLIYILVSFL